MIAIVDYGVGNLYSITHSLRHLGMECRITGDADQIERADKIILPGVGAFGDAMQQLLDTGLVPLIRERAKSGVPMLGICLGMQMLFDKSYEYGVHEGLGLIKGSICPLREDIDRDMKVPQIGWNGLHIRRQHPLVKYVQEGDCVYYVHSYYAKDCEESIVADSEYCVNVPGLVAKGNVAGAQFHPEKSGSVGLAILRAFSQWKGEETC